MHNSNFVSTRSIASACFLLLFVGCSSGAKFPVGTVVGNVTYQGKPAPEGTIVQFHSALGPAVALVRVDGTFEAREVRVGQYMVTVSPPIPIETDPQAQLDAYMQAEKEGRDPNATAKVLPVKYQLPGTSGITCEVTTGSNQLDLDLKD